MLEQNIFLKGILGMQFRLFGMILVLSSIALFSDEDAMSVDIPDSENSIESSVASIPDSENSVENSVASMNAPATQPDPYAGDCCPSPCCGVSRFQIGGNYTYAWVTPEGSPTTQGSLGGAQAIYEYRPLDNIYAGVAFAWRMGDTSNGPGERSLLDFDIQERLGYTYNGLFFCDSRFTLFTGFGCRYLGEKVTLGVSSVKFNYTEFYVPLGFLFEKKWNSTFAYGLNFQWMPQVLPMVQIKPLDGARWIIKKELLNFSVDVPLTFYWSDCISIIVDPFFQSWRDGHSTAKTITGLALGLPGNKYLFTGVNVNFAWSF